ncbi:MAG: hypothetical protein Q4G27_02980 [Flavobacteriaceae bacterium]|nr:hypothetical protein [Flavobacteriaceae bacterium]
MRKWFDLVLIVLLLVNLYRIFSDYKPETEIMGSTIPTWVSVVVQLLCIIVLGYKVYRDYTLQKPD